MQETENEQRTKQSIKSFTHTEAERVKQEKQELENQAKREQYKRICAIEEHQERIKNRDSEIL